MRPSYGSDSVCVQKVNRVVEDTPPEAHPMPPALLRANFSLALAAEGCPAVLVPTHTHLTAAENHKQTHRPLVATHTA